MHRCCLALRALALLALVAEFHPAHADAGAPAGEAMGVAIEDFSYRDVSGEPADQTAVHRKRLDAFMTKLRHDVEADRRYRLVPSPCVPDCAEKGDVPADRMHAVAGGDAGILITGGIQKLSTLVQWAKVTAVEVGTHRVLLDKLYTFRGDSDEAWERAEAFVSEDIRGTLATLQPVVPAVGAAPIGVAVFDFELEDTSAGASLPGEAASDVANLADATSGVRELLAQSGRYHVVDVGSANAEAVKAHALHDCGGCDAEIAMQLGADQSLVGVVRRVSRTEYTVRFQLRDSRTRAVVSEGDSGLRMGANYSWKRGAVRLISDRLLESRSAPNPGRIPQ